MTREFAAPREEAGQSLARIVTTPCAELSRTRVQELIEAGLVLVDDRVAKKGSQHLHGGERITVDAEDSPPGRAEAEAIRLDILYDDRDVIGVNKPTGRTARATVRTSHATLVQTLRGRAPTT